MKSVWTFVVILCVGLVDAAGKIVPDSPAQFTAKVVDEEGKPLEGMDIEGGIESEEPSQQGKTDRNGLFVFHCQKALMGQGGFVVNHNVAGYYESDGGLFFSRIENGRWVPWNPVVTAVVRRVVKPIPMYAKWVDTRIPTTNSPCGYDLMVGDWVAPYGRGVQTDFLFTITGFDNGMQNYKSHLQIELKGYANGIRRLPPDRSGSTFILCRTAPDSGYESIWTNTVSHLPGKSFYETQGGTFADPIARRWGYVFRIRSATNEQGKIVRAWYGKVRGPIQFFTCTERVLQFIYYLNPTPNDRNLEFDPQRNLFKDLKSTGIVTEP